MNNPTLETLQNFTKQQVFDFVVENLIKQGGPSVNISTTHCLYRGPNGRKCGIGFLITDEKYKSCRIPTLSEEHVAIFEGKNIHGVASSILLEIPEDWLNFLTGLQKVHDTCWLMIAWETTFFNKLKNFCTQHCLEYKFQNEAS